MRYVILRDDDTNASMTPDYLEKLYRPFLDRGLPVNLATIPNVNTEATFAAGRPELFLLAKKDPSPKTMPIASNPALVRYLLDNSGYHILQHGCRHDSVDSTYEFNQTNRGDIARRLDEGRRHLLEAGFKKPTTFVAPYDRLSRVSLEEVARRFQVLSAGWYDPRNLPLSWLPRYAVKRTLGRDHWRVGETILLSHPGCHLSYHKSYATMLDEIKRSIESRKLTVLVTHWWEYFREQKPDAPFIAVLHETAAWLAGRKDVKVISFDALVEQNVALN